MANILTYDSPTDLAKKATDWLEIQTKKTSAKSIYLPAGNTPIPIYQYWESTRPKALETLELLQIDDVAEGPSKDIFLKFFQQNLSHYLKQFKPILKPGVQADLGILGVGVNGHVAFHEPGIEPGHFCDYVTLHTTTTESLKLAPGTHGLTYGLGAFLKTKGLLLVVSGKSKREAFNKFQKNDLSAPVSYLNSHPNLTVLLEHNTFTLSNATS
jgi:6-phosphogluconolactonase/glucosamine-6-phosphate isomerase/deaminase